MLLTHPRAAEAAYRRAIQASVGNGRRVTDKQLKDIAISILIRVDKQSGAVGHIVDNVTSSSINSWVVEQRQYIKALKKEHKQRIAKHGRGTASRMLRSKTKFAARNSVGNLQSEVVSNRMAGLGINKFVWITKNDERVRDEHMKKHKKTYSMTTGAPTGDAFPGQGWACRCKSRPAVNKKARSELRKSVKSIKNYTEVFGTRVSANAKKIGGI